MGARSCIQQAEENGTVTDAGEAPATRANQRAYVVDTHCFDQFMRYPGRLHLCHGIGPSVGLGFPLVPVEERADSSILGVPPARVVSCFLELQQVGPDQV